MARSGAQLGVNIYAEVAQMRAATRELQTSVQQMGDSMDKLAGQAAGPAGGMAEAARTAQQMGAAFITAGGAILSGFAMSTKAAMDWELAYADVVKTVDASDEVLARLESDLRGLARTMPIAHGEIARIAAIAGQLGLQAPEIAAFTKTVAQMAVATTMSADEAAMSLARLSNILKLDVRTNVAGLADTMVHLGNNMAATETEISAMAMNFASAGATAGLSADEILGMSAALSSVGIHAEAGGTSLGRFALEMDGAVREGSDKLETFAATAGVTAEQFAQAYRTRPTEAMQMFLVGLNKVSEGGGNVVSVLRDLSLNEIRVRRALLAMAGNTDLLADSLRFANDGWNDSNALVEEVTKRFETAHMRVEIAKNTIRDTAITLGNQFIPVVASAADGVARWGQMMQRASEENTPMVTGIAGVGASTLLMVGAMAAAVPGLNSYRVAMQNVVKNGATPLMKGLGTIGTYLLGPWGVAIAGAVALGALWLDQKAKQVAKEEDWLNVLRETEGELDRSSKALIAQTVVTDDMAKAMDTAGASLGKLIDATAEGGMAAEKVNDIMAATAAYGDELANLSNIDAKWLEGRPEVLQAFEMLGIQTEDLTNLTQEQVNAVVKIAEEWDNQADALASARVRYEALSDAQKSATEDGGNLAEAMEAQNAVMEESVSLVKEMTDATLSMLGHQANVEEAFIKAGEAVSDYGLSLDPAAEGGRESIKVFDGLVTSINDEIEALYELAGGATPEVIERQTELHDRLRDNLSAWGASSEEIDIVMGALADFSTEALESNPIIADLRDTITLFGDTAGMTSGEIMDLTVEAANFVQEALDLQEQFGNMGGNAEILEDKIGELRDEFAEVMMQAGYTKEAAGDMFDALLVGDEIDATTAAIERLNEALGHSDEKWEAAENHARRMGERLGMTAEEAEGFSLAAVDIGREMENLTLQLANGEISVESYERQMTDLEDQLAETLEGTGLTDGAIADLSQRLRDGEDPAAVFRDALKEVVAEQDTAAASSTDWGKKLGELLTQMGLTEGQVDDLTLATKRQSDQAADVTQKWKDGEISGADLKREIKKMRDEFKEQATQMGLTEGQANELWKEFKRGHGITVEMELNIKGEYDWDMGGAWSGGGARHGHGSGGLWHGGPVVGPGTGTSDDIPTWLSNNEHVLTAREVDLAGGHSAIYALREQIRAGKIRDIFESPITSDQWKQTEGSIADLYASDEVQAFRNGGAVTNKGVLVPKKRFNWTVADLGKSPANRFAKSLDDWDESLQKSIDHALKDLRSIGEFGAGGVGGAGIGKIPGNVSGRVKAALTFARSMHGKRYRWGGGTPAGYDCSGFMAAIQKVLMGQRPYGRLYSTHAFNGAGPAGWQRNRRSGFMVGVTNAGVGHMSGTLAGVNVESASSGHKFGPSARGFNNPMYTSRWGFTPLADTGGVFGHGDQWKNMSGRPERVLNPDQTVAFERLVGMLGKDGIGGGGTTINQYGIDGFSDIQEINRAQDARDRARGVGRRG